MNKLPSARFKVLYPHLTETTEVTVNGHLIGTWTPIAHVQLSAASTPEESAPTPPERAPSAHSAPAPQTRPATAKEQQAYRDGVLRKMHSEKEGTP